MKNIIIIVIGLIILISLSVVASVKFDNVPGQTVEETYVWDTDEQMNEHDTNIEASTQEEKKNIYDFTVETANGDMVSRSDITGKPMVIHFWASWCGYCEYELPALQAMYEKYGDAVEFMVVCITDGEYETVESAKNYLSEKNYTFPVYFDVNLEALHGYALYELASTSRTYLFDAFGLYKSKANRAIDEEMLEEGILMILP